MRDLASLSAEDFRPHEGEAFEVSFDASDVRLTLFLIGVENLGKGIGHRDPFSLLFEGPTSPALEQSIHHLENSTFGQIEIFLVPVRPTPNGPRYQAVFA
jgi:hypothetical protein